MTPIHDIKPKGRMTLETNVHQELLQGFCLPKIILCLHSTHAELLAVQANPRLNELGSLSSNAYESSDEGLYDVDPGSICGDFEIDTLLA